MKPSAKAILSAWAIGTVLSISIWIGAIYVVYHFINKY